ncbi:hypothetical protein Ciccas_013448 [Cichlidogyrus casuarinus]|uniref:Uncharacterized protein n=1 Tax=Cichlidogyrus casuarinus TaxID=1844966 RepID=A0ABD2PKJ3_9PLAT
MEVTPCSKERSFKTLKQLCNLFRCKTMLGSNSPNKRMCTCIASSASCPCLNSSAFTAVDFKSPTHTQKSSDQLCSTKKLSVLVPKASEHKTVRSDGDPCNLPYSLMAQVQHNSDVSMNQTGKLGSSNADFLSQLVMLNRRSNEVFVPPNRNPFSHS